LYVLDKCCTSHGHNKNRVHSEPLLMEGSRPCALFDTSITERNWITHEQHNKYSKPIHPLIPKREDKFGNVLTEMDPWGRAAIFGNQPPSPKQGMFHYSSKQHYTGYRVSGQFGSGSSEHGRQTRKQVRDEHFDCHDNESRMDQLEGSLSAMHALYDFAKENLQGQIALPQQWVSTSASAPRNTSEDLLFGGEQFDENCSGDNARRRESGVSGAQFETTSKKSSKVAHDDGSSMKKLHANTTIPPVLNKRTHGLVTLAQMPVRKARRRSKRGA